ncbi:hypothetical protein GYMLUDRAFT_71122 [Collybiopsis luxurians FD-317 M1]|nr:hypothetical protein GYMLUDRAFT_71122 [Collybiopsis luxurians FD-317 M1]
MVTDSSPSRGTRKQPHCQYCGLPMKGHRKSECPGYTYDGINTRTLSASAGIEFTQDASASSVSTRVVLQNQKLTAYSAPHQVRQRQRPPSIPHSTSANPFPVARSPASSHSLESTDSFEGHDGLILNLPILSAKAIIWDPSDVSPTDIRLRKYHVGVFYTGSQADVPRHDSKAGEHDNEELVDQKIKVEEEPSQEPKDREQKEDGVEDLNPQSQGEDDKVKGKELKDQDLKDKDAKAQVMGGHKPKAGHKQWAVISESEELIRNIVNNSNPPGVFHEANKETVAPGPRTVTSPPTRPINPIIYAFVMFMAGLLVDHLYWMIYA